MTETLLDPNPAAPAPAPRRLERDDNDKILAGVCAGFGRYTGTDPVVWRITIAVLTFFGAAGLFIYAIGWIFMPKVGEASSRGERLLRRRPFALEGRSLVIVAGALAAVAIVAGYQDRLQAALAIAAIGVVFLLTMRHLEDRKVNQESGAPPAVAFATTALTAPVVVRTPPKPRSKLGLVTLSVGATVSAILVGMRLNGVHALTAPRIVAVALVIVGAGLVVGTWVGRARWLIAVAILLGLSIAPAALAEDAARDGVGNRTWTPTSSSSPLTYDLGVGEGRLDLSQLPRTGLGAPIHARVRVGHLLVTVPTTMRVHVIAHTGMGEVLIVGESHGGTRVDQDAFVGPVGAPIQELDLRVGIGQVEVRRA